MSEDDPQPFSLRVRDVKVELLRAGPAHNQLLSPLTPYLGICNGAEAGIVTVPFEHHAFMRRLSHLRDAGVEARERQPALREMGIAMAGVFGAIPHLPGSLDGDWAGSDDLVHLRLVLSASELAVLPFEMAKVASGTGNVSEDWLSLQARVPVVMTRRTREVPPSRLRWPARARILFIAGDPDNVPFESHRRALVNAVQPYLKIPTQQGRHSDDGRREDFEDTLTILRNSSFDDVVSACSGTRYTHVHVLAHGATDPRVEEASYGLVLNRRSGDEEVISGERLASALCRLIDGFSHGPTVATLAACDGGNLGSVLITGASMAHALHRAGIPFVVASQFPLSKEGSDLVAEQLYPGLLAGEHPLPLLHRLRTDLHARHVTRSNDWASLVVYESFADDLAAQFEEVRYRQAVRAMNLAADRLLQVAPGALRPSAEARRALTYDLQQRADALPVSGPYRLECLGVRGAGYKRLAEAEFEAALDAQAGSTQRREAMHRCLSRLEEARQLYEQAAAGFMLRGKGDVRDASTLHWVLGQQVCLSAVLGRAARAGSWETARLCAEVHMEGADNDARAWGLGTLAELWMLRLADPRMVDLRQSDWARYEDDCQKACNMAKQHLLDMLRLTSGRMDHRVVSTRRQLQRYVRWWGHADLEGLVRDLPSDPGTVRSEWGDLGIVQLAQELLRMLPGDDGPPPGPDGGDCAAAAPPDVPPGPDSSSGNLGWPPTTPEPMGAPPPAPSEAPSPPAPSTADAPTSSIPRQAADAHFSVHMLPAAHGDCLWIEYGVAGERHRVLVDCGTAATWASQLKPRIEALAPDQRRFELFILSHIDDDHIGGAIPMLEEARALGLKFGDVWFNGWRHMREFSVLNARQGEEFSSALAKGQQPWNAWKNAHAIVLPDEGVPQSMKLPGGMSITLLSPTTDKLRTLAPRWAKEIAALGMQPGEAYLAEDAVGAPQSTDVPALAATAFKADPAANNGSSIAVLAEYAGKSVLLAADAHAPLLQAAVARLIRARGGDRLRIDAFKLPHHGSQNNLSTPLLALLDCKHFLVSTSGARFRHPDRPAIARALMQGGRGTTLHFNYRSRSNEVWSQPELQQVYGYTTEYPPEGQAGLKVIL